MFSKVVLLVSMIIGASGSIKPRPQVDTQSGLLMGNWKTTSKGSYYASFEGIPYSMPPVGEHRLKPPRPVQRQPGVRDAGAPGPICLQYNGWTKIIGGSEDCLFVNVYSPRLPSHDDPNPKLPVIAYIHGGAYLYGAGVLYNPLRLMDYDVVFVSINYRLGALGFLSTQDQASPGNYGLKDQAEALRWIRANVESFGGDPDNINLAGHSAGSASVHYHCLADEADRAPFRRGIALSGSAFNPWAFAYKPKTHAQHLAGILGCPTNNSTAIVDCIMKKPALDIAYAQSQMYTWYNHLFTPFVPTKEPNDTERPFITEHPFIRSLTGNTAHVPLLATIVTDEGLYPSAAYQNWPHTLDDLEAHWEELSSLIFFYKETLIPELQPAAARKIKDHYLDGKPVSQNTFRGLTKALSNRLYDVGIANMVQEHALRTGQPTYFLNYEFPGQYSLSNMLAENHYNYGVCHGDDILHIFLMSEFPFSAPMDLKITDILINILVSYSTTGEPKVLDGTQWLPESPTAEHLSYLKILAPDHIYMDSRPDYGNKTFWSQIYSPMYNLHTRHPIYYK